MNGDYERLLFELDQAILSARMQGFDGTEQALTAIRSELTNGLESFRLRRGSIATISHRVPELVLTCPNEVVRVDS